MPTPTLKFLDKESANFKKDLAVVMEQLNAELNSLLAGGVTQQGLVDAAVILNNRNAMIEALNRDGYNELAVKYVGKYPELAKIGASRVAQLAGVTDLKYGQVSVDAMMGLARVDLEGFAAIGENAIDDLRLALYRDAVGGATVKDISAQIAASTIGTSVKGSPLSNYSYTHANTALLNFSGEVLRLAGEELGAEMWEVVGPLDSLTRQVCRDALSEKIRSKKEWQKAGYWGGTPGGWNCRHQLYPYFGDDK